MEIVGLFLLILFMLLGMPVAFALLTAGAIGLFLIDIDSGFSVLTTTPYRAVANFTLSTIPLFILMAEFLSRSGFAKDLYDSSNKWVGHFPGGLGISSILTCALMGTMSGSTTATAAAMSRIAIPEMDRHGYNRIMSTGIIAFGGTIAGLIPPSIGLIIYGIQTETSIGKLLIAGIIPGVLLTLLLSLGIYLRAKTNPAWAPVGFSFSWKEKIYSLKYLWAVIIILLVVIGSIYSGFATATESAALGAGASALLGFLTKRLSLKDFYESLISTIRTTTMIFSIIIGAMVFGYYLTITGMALSFITFLTTMDVPNIGILILVLFVYLILGFFMDAIAILLLTLPLTFPVIIELGYDPIWFGILVIMMVEIGLVTPPLGVNAFVVSSISKEPINNVFRGSVYMVLIALITLTIIVIFPNLVTWLPSTIKGI
ncbi:MULTISPECIES: TRAP transporter large permease [Sporosarcina]|uniref:TRAP transporter large permease n=1 Tax=Sporosarcina TaxID=1569 RepID=UPI000A14D35A|nr:MULTISPECIES: TRAP transporter large permease [Sporosarcina]ARJ39591.1 C4-dicarboxylate ABC transporter permease [Sporosarcina ureae]PIC68009.1 TRAP transporter large permease [Sporosarcina sp. P16a]PIC83106.1 TRAP transporter large permease [Sporosarcina sp. P1]PIC90926.1 TRAP transporter large permease [Sporosarcina sp. P21c]PIC94318.1 TRAP transporter large permease [Sporosarcina sp. P25]